MTDEESIMASVNLWCGVLWCGVGARSEDQ